MPLFTTNAYTHPIDDPKNPFSLKQREDVVRCSIIIGKLRAMPEISSGVHKRQEFTGPSAHFSLPNSARTANDRC